MSEGKQASPGTTGLGSSSQPVQGVERRRSRASLWVAAGLAIMAIAIALLRLSALPISETLAAHATLQSVYDEAETQIAQILLVPIAALVVVFFRLTLGLRMLGPFRPILIAVALHSVGMIIGIVFMVGVTGVATLLRPRFKPEWLPYYARLAMLLCVVVLVEIALVMLGAAMDWSWTARTIFFPIIVLTLTIDGFARKLNAEGPAVAVWCGVWTLIAALLCKAIMDVPGIPALLVNYPETLLLVVASILVISSHLDRRFLASWNPAPAQ